MPPFPGPSRCGPAEEELATVMRTRRIFIGALPPTATTEVLWEHFQQFGRVCAAFRRWLRHSGAWCMPGDVPVDRPVGCETLLPFDPPEGGGVRSPATSCWLESLALWCVGRAVNPNAGVLRNVAPGPWLSVARPPPLSFPLPGVLVPQPHPLPPPHANGQPPALLPSPDPALHGAAAPLRWGHRFS